MSLSAGTPLGPYEIVGLLGAGGMGEVYRASDTRLKRDVALKVIADSFAHDKALVARFQREAELLATLTHQHIAAADTFQDAVALASKHRAAVWQANVADPRRAAGELVLLLPNVFE